MEAALYDPEHGFYETGGRAGGRQGHFLTSPETGGLFGAVVARALDRWWRELGRPDPYIVVEAGAGPGTLARTILASQPECAGSLRYVLVERSATQRASYNERLPLEDPAFVLPPRTPDEGDVPAEPGAGAGTGPLCTGLAELPRIAGTPVVVLANELLDNLPLDLAEHRGGRWQEVRIDVSAAGTVREALVPLDEARADVLEHLVPDPPAGGRVPLQRAAKVWLQDALATAGEGGRLVVIDYASRSPDLVRRTQDTWLRTYSDHGRGSAHLERLGEQDITCEVALDQLALVKPPTEVVNQAEWLRSQGLDDVVAKARETWEVRAHLGDLEALRARSHINEAQALTDPAGLGAFQVITWQL